MMNIIFTIAKQDLIAVINYLVVMEITEAIRTVE